jgi:hypothetical protein
MVLVPLVVSIAGLMPGQSHLALGIELLAIAAVLAGVMARLPIASGTVLLAVGALAELFAIAGGLYWVAGAIVVLTLGAVINAGVLLVEILR